VAVTSAKGGLFIMAAEQPASKNRPTQPDRATAPHDGNWRTIIRAERLRVGLTQAEVARQAGLAGETIRKYEAGTRLPSREALERILEVLQVPVSTVHAVMLDRGFHHPESRFLPNKEPGYYFTLGELPDAVDQVPWPMFTSNELGEIAAANRAAQALWGLDFAAELGRRSRVTANLFVAMAEPGIADRIANWDEILRHFVALYKAVPAAQTMLDAPGALFSEIIAAFATVSPQRLGRLFELWQTTPPREAKVRWMYPVVWREPGFPEIRFHGIVNPASEPLGIGFNEWIPVDAASHAALEAVIASRAGGNVSRAPGNKPPGRARC
jgi:transcriptional regulator with XRE-family HTH domain